MQSINAEHLSQRSIKEIAAIPVSLCAPPEMRGALKAVLGGEYESGYFGESLTILDIGANVGSFAIWANLRWPNSTIYSYEPHPETYKMLLANVKSLKNVICRNTAIYPTDRQVEPFWSRYPGDGEAGLVICSTEIFKDVTADNVIEVPVLHPRELPSADVIKLDVEGAEAAIVGELDVRNTSLILMEYHNSENKSKTKELLKDDFSLEFEDSISWDSAVRIYGDYQEKLIGDWSGRMFFANRQKNRLYRPRLVDSI